MTSILYPRTLIGMFPNRSLMVFTGIKLPGNCAGRELHQPANIMSIRYMHYYVDMVTCDAITIDRYMIPL